MRSAGAQNESLPVCGSLGRCLVIESLAFKSLLCERDFAVLLCWPLLVGMRAGFLRRSVIGEDCSDSR